MPADFSDRCDAIEECYEFMLAYAGQGLPSDEGSQRAAKSANSSSVRSTHSMVWPRVVPDRWPSRDLSLPQNIKLSFQFCNAMPRILSLLSSWCWLSHQSAPS